jgi:adenylate cyclase
MFGVEIWANTAQSIFTNRYPVLKQGFFTTLAQLLVVTLAGMLLVVGWRLWGFLAALGVLVAYVAGAYVLFAIQTQGEVGNGPVEVPSLGYVIPSAFWWVIGLGYLLFEEQRAVSRTQSTFGRFVTPAVARTIMDREESGQLALGGEDRRVTVLFGDIRGFTTISEGMTPAVLLGHLNRYFDGMVNIVNRYEGTVNKYNGDNIMVIWGAPIEVADEARKAVECALEMQKWIQTERAKGGPDVSFGFGINTGHVVAGFLGAMGRMEYTVIGDTANVASRLTSADIARRDQVACSAETLGELGDDVDYVDLGAIQVKGRAEPVACYQINRIGVLTNPNAAPAMKITIGTAVVAGSH